MVEVRFYGALKQFGQSFRLAARTPKEALHALFTQIQGLRQHIQQGYYKVRIGSRYMDNRFLDKELNYVFHEGDRLHITPVVKGAKKAGVFNVIIGVVLMVASIWTGGATFAAGLGMVVGGAAQMLTKTPKMNQGNNGVDKKQSTSFNNLQNMAAQGNPVPLAYGRIRTGSLIISQGVETFDA